MAEAQTEPAPVEMSEEEKALNGLSGARALEESASSPGGIGTFTEQQFKSYQEAFSKSSLANLGGHVSRTSNGYVQYEGPLYKGGTVSKVDVTNRIKGAFEHLKSRGLTDTQAYAMLGNCLGESRTLNPFDVGDGGHARGICQWHEDRQARFFQLKGYHMGDPQATVGGKPVGDQQRVNDQLDFALHEMNTTEAKAGRRFFAAKDNMEEAVRGMVDFERPADRAGAVNTRYGLAAGLKANPALAATDAPKPGGKDKEPVAAAKSPTADRKLAV